VGHSYGFTENSSGPLRQWVCSARGGAVARHTQADGGDGVPDGVHAVHVRGDPLPWGRRRGKKWEEGMRNAVLCSMCATNFF